MSPVFLGKEYDQTAVTPDLSKIKTYFIFASPRTGSTLLCSLLYNVAGYGVPYEYFNKSINMSKRLGVSDTPRNYASIDMDAYINALLANRTTNSNMAWGAKVFPPHVQWMLQSETGAKLLQNSPVIRLSRRSKIDQAISHSIAAQTGKWNTTSAGRAEATAKFQFGKILTTLHRLQMQEVYWELLISKYKLNPLEVTYEDLTTHTQAVGEKVMKYLTGDATTHKFSTTATDVIKVEKQDNALNDDFRTRFFARLKFERAGVNKKLLAYQEEE